MKEFTLLLLDANVVIELFSRDFWEEVVNHCDIHLTEIVVSESKFHVDESGRKIIDLDSYIDAKDVTVHEVNSSDVEALIQRFGLDFVRRIHAGEAESLAFLVSNNETYTICSSDAIVFRVLGALSRSAQGISLEEVLNRIGLRRKLAHQFTKRFRDKWSNEGFRDGLSGVATRKPYDPG